MRASLDDVDWVAAARSVVDQGWARRRSALARDACARLLDAAPGARVADPDGELTPQEEHIAWLARDGRTNTEIGPQLYISAGKALGGVHLHRF